MIIDEEFIFWNKKFIDAFGEGISVSVIPYNVYADEVYELVKESLRAGENLLKQKFH